MLNWNKTENTRQEKCGFYISMDTYLSAKEKSLICAIKGFLIFLVTAGCIGGVLSSFSLNCHMGLILLLLFLLSMGTSLLRMQRFAFNVGYPLLFVLFVMGISSSYRIVNGGFQIFVSAMQSAYSDYYKLSMVREVDEFAYSAVTAVTYAAVFIGFFLILLLNMIVSEHMSFFGVLLLTFPIFQMGIYIGKYPAAEYTFSIIAGYIAIGIWKMNGHYQIPMKRKEQTTYQTKVEKTLVLDSYRVDGKSLLGLGAVALVLTVCISMILIMTQAADSFHRKENHILRASIDRRLEIITQNGLGGLFDRYEATGGLSGGKLGGVASVRPDFETDLQITYVPYSVDNVYLKGYVGTYYTGHSWEAYYPVISTGYPEYGMNDIFSTTKSLVTNRVLDQRMRIENIGASEDYLYLPYYVSHVDTAYENTKGVLSGESPINGVYDVEFVTGNHVIESLPLRKFKDRYSRNEADRRNDYTEFDTVYLSIPSGFSKELQVVMDEIGYSDSIEGQILLIQNYFKDNFTYSMSPGATPYRQDYVLYFLKNQRRGYCAHYASAATILLRAYGIYARYVEGYCFSPVKAVGTVLVDEKVTDWGRGSREMQDAQVVSMEVTDGDAHAWVEVYIENVGWVPYEFTLGTVEEQEPISGTGFFSLFSNLITGNGFTGGGTGSQEAIYLRQDLNLKQISGTVGVSVLFVLVALGLLLLLVFFVRKVFSHLQMKRRFQRGDYRDYLLWKYQKTYRKRNGNMEALNDVYEILEKCCFSKQGISQKEAKYALERMESNLP